MFIAPGRRDRKRSLRSMNRAIAIGQQRLLSRPPHLRLLELQN